MQRSVLALALVVMWTTGGAALPNTGQQSGLPAPASSTGTTTCDLIESAAAADGLPVEYFTRLIWTESNFRPEAVSPKGAQGIAQFMPATAAERGLADPFDPRQAIPASASLLKQLAERFGNLGLAAAAYNSGPRRVEEWLAGTGGMPRETRAYVAAITGMAVEEWRTGPASGDLASTGLASGDPASTGLASDDPADAEQQTGPTTCLEVLSAINASLPAMALQAPEPGPQWQPWGVQVAANFSQSVALASYRRLQKLHPAVLGEIEPLVIRKVNLSFGRRPIINVRLPAPTRQAANELCGQLRSNGAICVVLKN